MPFIFRRLLSTSYTYLELRLLVKETTFYLNLLKKFPNVFSSLSYPALKTKQGDCGTSRLSIQIVQTSPTSRVLAGIQMDTSDWFGWFPLQLQAPANLVVNDQIGVKLSEGCIYGHDSVDHITTNFGGFVIASL